MLTFVGSFAVNEVFEFCCATGESFSHVLAFLQYGLAVFTKLNFFYKHLFIVLEI